MAGAWIGVIELNIMWMSTLWLARILVRIGISCTSAPQNSRIHEVNSCEDLQNPHLLTTTMPACKSQKRAELDKRIDKPLAKLLNGQFQSIWKSAQTNNISYIILLQRYDANKSTVGFQELQILTILKNNMLTECIAWLAIIKHLLKYNFIYILTGEIQLLQINLLLLSLIYL